MTSKSVEEIAKEYADKKCLEIQRRRNLGLDPYPIHAAIIDDVKYGYQLSQDRIAELQEAFDTAYNTGEYLKQELDKLKAESKTVSVSEINKSDTQDNLCCKYETQKAVKGIGKPKIIQIAIAAFEGRGIVALMSDGTLWEKYNSMEWQLITPPQQEKEDSDK